MSEQVVKLLALQICIYSYYLLQAQLKFGTMKGQGSQTDIYLILF